MSCIQVDNIVPRHSSWVSITKASIVNVGSAIPGTYADNAEALGAGLVPGDIYLEPGSNPQLLCIVFAV